MACGVLVASRPSCESIKYCWKAGLYFPKSCHSPAKYARLPAPNLSARAFAFAAVACRCVARSCHSPPGTLGVCAAGCRALVSIQLVEWIGSWQVIGKLLQGFDFAQMVERMPLRKFFQRISCVAHLGANQAPQQTEVKAGPGKPSSSL